MLDFDTKYRAVLSRDRRFDGWFIVGVLSTGIYCRPSCPTPVHPKPANVEFFSTAAAAQRRGLRSCKRCRPDAVPGSPELRRRDDLATRALRLIEDGVVDRVGVCGLADELATSVRQLNRAVVAELGAPPLEIARSRRAHNARILIETTDLTFADIAFAAGFGSIRQFNDTIRAVYDSTPSGLRKTGDDVLSTAPGSIALRLPLRTPFDSAHIFGFLSTRAVDTVETGDEAHYERWMTAAGGPAHVQLEPSDDHISARLSLTEPSDLASVVNRCRRMLDLDADSETIDDHLGSDPVLGPLVTRRPGLRSPGTIDPFEAAVRAIVGQQVTVAGSIRTLEAIAEKFGEPIGDEDRRLFPSPGALADCDPASLPVPAGRANAIRILARAVHDGTIDLGIGVDPGELDEALRSVRGVGPWTSSYVRMRGLCDPDVYLAGDLVVERAASRFDQRPDPTRWAPWRSYATHHLWVHEQEAKR